MSAATKDKTCYEYYFDSSGLLYDEFNKLTEQMLHPYNWPYLAFQVKPLKSCSALALCHFKDCESIARSLRIFHSSKVASDITTNIIHTAICNIRCKYYTVYTDILRF